MSKRSISSISSTGAFFSFLVFLGFYLTSSTCCWGCTICFASSSITFLLFAYSCNLDFSDVCFPSSFAFGTGIMFELTIATAGTIGSTYCGCFYDVGSFYIEIKRCMPSPLLSCFIFINSQYACTTCRSQLFKLAGKLWTFLVVSAINSSITNWSSLSLMTFDANRSYSCLAARA